MRHALYFPSFTTCAFLSHASDAWTAHFPRASQAVINALVELGVIKPTGDALTIRRAVSYFLDNLARQTEQQETIQVRVQRVLDGC